ncbi:MAG: lipopolysaccharide biosynthesis protein [Planctomycetia bacterium]|nr:lipopolysaccharide biosynthesis protein [Planctomycetia bacterium]
MPPHVRRKVARPARRIVEDSGRGSPRRLGASRFVRFDRQHALARKEAAAARDIAPLAGWSQLVADSMLVSGSTLFCQAIGVVTSLLFRSLISPLQMGVWQGLKLFLSYGNYLNLGVSKGAARELAVARGRGDESQAEAGLHAAFTANTLASLALAAGLIVASVWQYQFHGGWSNPWAGGLVAMALLVMLQRYETFLVTIQRARQQFAITSQLAVIEALLTLAVGGLATWRWGLPGLYVSAGCVLIAAIGYLQWNAPTSLRWHWDYDDVRRLTAIGLPMLLTGVLSSLFRSLDKLMILACMSDGTYQLGCYSVALLVGTQLYGIANQLAMVGAPRYAELWGGTNDRRAVAQLVAQNSQFIAWALAGAGLLAVVVATPALSWLLPSYAEGLPALSWLAPGVAAAGLAVPLTNYLATIDRQGRSLTILGAAAACTAVLLRIAIGQGSGLVGVAAVTSLASLGYLVALAGTSIWPELNGDERRRYVLHLSGALLLLALPALARWSFGGEWNDDSGERFLTCLGLLGGWGFAAMCGWTWASQRRRDRRRSRVARELAA